MIPLPDTLYHYTTAGGLISILKSKSIWTTNVRFLNDTSELRYAVLRARELWDEPRAKYRKQYAEICDLALSMGMQSVYVACFSKRKDDLSQWRAYARPGGVCIGFSRAALGRAIPEPGRDFSGLGPCYYDDDELKDQLMGLKSQIDANLTDFGSTDERLLIDAIDLVDIASCSKNAKFAAEEEVRLVFEPPALGTEGERASMTFSEKNGVVVPHCEVSLLREDDSPWLHEVIVGPTPDPDAAIWAVQQLAEFHRIDVSVTSSEIPYRDW